MGIATGPGRRVSDLDSLTGILLSSFAVAVSGALMPGPVLTVTISESARRGFWAGPLIILGHGILEAALVVLLLLGFANFLQSPRVIGVIGVSGGIALFFFAFAMFKGLKGLTLDLSHGEGKGANPVMAGILTSLANPYWTIWWATIGLGYLFISIRFGLLGVAVFFIGHISADLAWYSAISFFVSRGKNYISDSVYRGVIFCCALVLMAFGGYFGCTGARHLF